MNFCVYLTTYSGKRLPRYYVGSTNINRIQHGYFGSVSSKKWKDIWKEELDLNPDLFTIKIISYHETREAALRAELEYQKQHNVVLSEQYINESFAQVRGYAGRNVSGVSNPMYGRGAYVTQWCKENPDKVSKRNRKAAYTQWQCDTTREKKIQAMQGVKKTRKNLTEEEFRHLQREKSLKSKEKNATKVTYNGITYASISDLTRATGISLYMYKKLYREEVVTYEDLSSR
jgi:hypothetical protein